MKPLIITPKDTMGDPVLPISAHREHTFTRGQSKSSHKLDTMGASWVLQVPSVQGTAVKNHYHGRSN